jgi:hypothetical protein
MQYHLRACQRLADQLAVAGQNDAFDPKRDIGIDPITVLASACGQAFCLPEGCPRNGDAPNSPPIIAGSPAPSAGIFLKT